MDPMAFSPLFTAAAPISEEVLGIVNRFLDIARAEDLRRRQAEEMDLLTRTQVLPTEPMRVTLPVTCPHSNCVRVNRGI